MTALGQASLAVLTAQALVEGDDLYCRPAADEVAAYLAALLATRG